MHPSLTHHHIAALHCDPQRRLIFCSVFSPCETTNQSPLCLMSHQMSHTERRYKTPQTKLCLLSALSEILLSVQDSLPMFSSFTHDMGQIMYTQQNTSCSVQHVCMCRLYKTGSSIYCDTRGRASFMLQTQFSGSLRENGGVFISLLHSDPSLCGPLAKYHTMLWTTLFSVL